MPKPPVNTKKLAADLATLAVRYEITATELIENALQLKNSISHEVHRKESEKNRRNSIPERNREIIKKSLDGTSRIALSEGFNLGKDTIAEIISGGRRDIVKRVYDLKEPAQDVAQEYDVSTNQIFDLVRKSVTSDRDSLALSLIEMDICPWNRPGEVDRLRSMTSFLNDYQTTFFVIRDSFEPDEYKTINNRSIVWSVEPALIIFYDETFVSVPVEQGVEIARTIETSGSEISFDGRPIDRIVYVSGEPIWKRAK